MPSATDTAAELNRLRNLPAEHVRTEFDKRIPTELTPPPLFWESYSEENVVLGQRACLILDVSNISSALDSELLELLVDSERLR